MAKISWAEIDKLRAAMKAPRLTINQAEDSEVKFVEYDFNDPDRYNPKLSTLEIIHLTDLQFGSKGFQKEKFKAYVEWILSSPVRYVVLGGDLIDAATVISVASPYENDGEPIEQVEGVVELLQPLADKGRILGSVGGNHERRTIKTYGDCGRAIAKELKVPYSRGVQFIDILFGDHKPLKISLWHGGGSARTKGAKAQMLHRFMHQADSHIYLVGHLHDVVVLFDWRQSRVGKKIKLQKIAGIMSSSFQGYWNSYAEVAAMSPSDTMMGRIIVEKDGKWSVSLK